MRDNRRHPQLMWYSEGEEGNSYHSAGGEFTVAKINKNSRGKTVWFGEEDG